MKCCDKKTIVTMEYPIEYENFISYPTYCHSFGTLVHYNLAKVVFPSVLYVEKPVSILTCTTNTPVYDEECNPITCGEIESNRPYDVYFDEVIGGYVLDIPKCVVKKKKDTIENSKSVVKTEVKK